MKTLKMQRRLAASALKVGQHKVWFDPMRIDDIKEALTKVDIEELIKDNAIKSKIKMKKKEKAEISKKYPKKKARKRQRSTGHIRKKLRKRKEKYVKLIRKLRKFLKMLKLNGALTTKEYNYLRKLAKAGQFKSRRHLQEHIKEKEYKEMLEKKEEKERKKVELSKKPENKQENITSKTLTPKKEKKEKKETKK